MGKLDLDFPTLAGREDGEKEGEKIHFCNV